MFASRPCTASLALLTACAAAPGLARADGLQPGYWKITSTPEINDTPAPPQEKMRCMTSAETADLDKTFSPEASTINSACERVEHALTPETLKWRLKCTGRAEMDVAGAFHFETPRRYVAEVRTQFSLPGQTTRSRVTIIGERVGDCP